MKIYDMNEEQFSFEVREMLHRVKYEDSPELWFNDQMEEALENVDQLTETQFERCCILATFVQGAFQKYKKFPIPLWCYSKKFVMNRAYLSKDIVPEDIMRAEQAEYFHNVFLGTCALDVL